MFLVGKCLKTHVHGGGEAARVLGGCHNQRVDVGLAQILKIQLLGQLDDARGGSYVEGSGALALGLQGVADLAVGKGLGLNRNNAGKSRERKVSRGKCKVPCIFYDYPRASSSPALVCACQSLDCLLTVAFPLEFQ